MADSQNQEPLDGEMIAMNIIASAGDARSFAFGALEEAKKGNFDEADRLLEECKKAGVAAHRAPVRFADCGGERQCAGNECTACSCAGSFYDEYVGRGIDQGNDCTL